MLISGKVILDLGIKVSVPENVELADPVTAVGSVLITDDNKLEGCRRKKKAIKLQNQINRRKYYIASWRLLAIFLMGSQSYLSLKCTEFLEDITIQ